MDGQTSTALAPISPAEQPAARAAGCGGKRSLFTGWTKWFLVATVALAAAGLALGSGLVAASALLPLLYVLPCLLMMGMCMRGHGKAVHRTTATLDNKTKPAGLPHSRQIWPNYDNQGV